MQKMLRPGGSAVCCGCQQKEALGNRPESAAADTGQHRYVKEPPASNAFNIMTFGDEAQVHLFLLLIPESNFEAVEEKLETAAAVYLSAAEMAAVRKYRFSADRVRALCSRMLQRRVLAAQAGVNPKDVLIERALTGSKPIWVLPNNEAEINGFIHFNVSHDNEMVAIAASPFLVGVDCMRVKSRGARSAEMFLDSMKEQCTAQEWVYVTAALEIQQQLYRFMRIWTMKEAYVKTIGTGIYTDPIRLDCRFDEHPSISLDGVKQVDFRFAFDNTVDGYVVCICIGPTEKAYLKYFRLCPPDAQKLVLPPNLVSMQETSASDNLCVWHRTKCVELSSLFESQI